MSALRVGIFRASAWAAGLLLFGCGGNGVQGSPAAGGATGSAGSSVGSSGKSSSGGATGGAGGSAGANLAGANAGTGGFVLGDSKTEACIAYALAVCARQAQCAGRQVDGCLSGTLLCPDVTFSPGSTRTVADVQACAEAYQNLQCDQLELGILPACVTPGTVALGQPCEFPSQCASLSCDSSSTCGSCVSAAHEGESCASNQLCAGLLVCASDKCVKRSESSAGIALGEACSNAAGMYCKSGLRCDAASSKCAEYPSQGMPCEDTHSCLGDSYCDIDVLTCKAFPGEGMPCGDDGFGGAGYCLAPLQCGRTDSTVGVCKKPPTVGEPCLLDSQTSAPKPVPCDESARCDATTTPPMCAAKIGPGQPCRLSSDCTAGTSCICPTGQGSCDVTAPICGHYQLKDQPCTAPGDVCHPGFSCTAGVCQPRESQGLFAAECPP